jgi:alanyl-tRNA synthetase
MMTSAQIRQSFLDFFRSKQHAVVPSSSLMPDSPNLLFTNAGMNQFVPFFLGQKNCPYRPARVADTQKCIRAGGKHNDLEDVGWDTYHHTFFEMLGNWSFGDYFKKEAIEWAWELIVKHWNFPPERLYATVYQPGEGDPSEFDQEAYEIWERIFRSAKLDPKIHIVNGGKKDNFWMMGETGPCGPCSEIHFDLTPQGDSQGKLVNQGDARCIEFWNLVFIQFNATADGHLHPLPARHVDTGMGFERVTSLVQGTRNFQCFDRLASNYDTDIFRPIFLSLEKLCEKKYTGSLPQARGPDVTEQEKVDVAFRVIGDHIRTLSFAIADGIQPSNEGRGYVLRRILRRAVRYGRNLGIKKPFLAQLVPVLLEQMGKVFPELIQNQHQVKAILRGEEESFNRTLDRGMTLFREALDQLQGQKILPGEVAFELYDTYGFPLDLTELLAQESGVSVDQKTFESCMAAQRKRSQAAQKKVTIEVTEALDQEATLFVGYERLKEESHVMAVKDNLIAVEQTPFYAEMGGQVGDQGVGEIGNLKFEISNTYQSGQGVYWHELKKSVPCRVGDKIKLVVDQKRRQFIQGHHSGTHLLNWALREALGSSVKQKGSYVGPDRLRFDFSSPKALEDKVIEKIEAQINECIARGDQVQWYEESYDLVKNDPTILQFFGEKYGEIVRIVDIGGYSKELCGGTHVRNTNEIGFFKIVSESAIAAGVRRIEAVAGGAILDYLAGAFKKQNERYDALCHKRVLSEALPDLSLDSLSAKEAWEQFEKRESALMRLETETREWMKEQQKLEAARVKEESLAMAKEILSEVRDEAYIKDLGEKEGKLLPFIIEGLKEKMNQVVVLGAKKEGRANLIVWVPKSLLERFHAGKLIQTLLPLVGGKGGGRADLAQGAGSQVEGLGQALAKARELLSE